MYSWQACHMHDGVSPQVQNMFTCLISCFSIAACSLYMISCATKLQHSLLTKLIHNEPLCSYQQHQPKQSSFLLKKSMLQTNLCSFRHQNFKVTPISNLMGCFASPMVAQPYFEFKYDGNMWIQLRQLMAHDKHKQQVKFAR